MAKISVPSSRVSGKKHVPIAIHVPPVIGIFERLTDWRKDRGKKVRGTAQTVNKGHGRLEVRTIVTSAALRGFLDWPAAEQVMQITRTVTKLKSGETTKEQVYAITSLPPERGTPRFLLAANRGHWGIENGLHWVRDVTLGEDGCAVPKDHAPQILAVLRNVMLTLLRLHGHKNIAAAIDRYSARPEQAMRTMGLTTRP